MRWLNDEQGATAVIFALLLIPAIGFGAIVLDVGHMYWETRQLQNGADAAALAIAQDCAGGECGTAQANTTGDGFANANSNDTVSDADVQLPGSEGPYSVTVTTTTRTQTGDTFLTHWLAGVIGVPTSTFERSATAIWEGLSAATSVPLTISQCEWDEMTGGDLNNLPTDKRVIYFHSSQTAEEVNTCGGDPANQDHPGGFGWLSPEGGECEAYIEDGETSTDTGNDVPKECSSEYFESLLGEIIILPIFGSVEEQGSNAVYTIVGFAALELTGYRLSGNPEWNRPVGDTPCGGNDRCISGRFVEYYDLNAAPDPDAPDLGAYAVALVG